MSGNVVRKLTSVAVAMHRNANSVVAELVPVSLLFARERLDIEARNEVENISSSWYSYW